MRMKMNLWTRRQEPLVIMEVHFLDEEPRTIIRRQLKQYCELFKDILS